MWQCDNRNRVFEESNLTLIQHHSLGHVLVAQQIITLQPNITCKIMTTIKSCIVLMNSLVMISCAPLHYVAIQTEAQAMIYLSQFGYLNPSENNQGLENIRHEDSMAQAIMAFQSFVGQNPTGHLDKKTLNYMNMPRCGISDTMGLTSRGERGKNMFGPGNRYLDQNLRFRRNKIFLPARFPVSFRPGLRQRLFTRSLRSRRYALIGSRWQVKDLKYKISKYGERLSKSKTDSTIRKAFDLWSSVVPLTFTQIEYGKVDIEIRFEKGKHEDIDKFDGPNGVLAHAIGPNSYGSYAHFDDSENWSLDTGYGAVNFFQVAAHEFGHTLGLSHSNVKSALMWPNAKSSNPSLDSDDIQGIQSLYGARSRSQEWYERKTDSQYSEEKHQGDGIDDSGDHGDRGYYFNGVYYSGERGVGGHDSGGHGVGGHDSGENGVGGHNSGEDGGRGYYFNGVYYGGGHGVGGFVSDGQSEEGSNSGDHDGRGQDCSGHSGEGYDSGDHHGGDYDNGDHDGEDYQ